MDELIVDENFIDQYWKGTKRHKNYTRALDVSHHLRFHFDGYFKRPWQTGGSDNKPELINPYFTRLIDSRRPSESDIIKTYRRDAYLPETKTPCNKVVNCLKKIVKSPDWQIDYANTESPKSLPDNFTLERYCEKEYPKDNSIENWTYKTAFRWLCVDPNAWWVAMPINFEIKEGEFYKPYAHIIECKDVYDFKDEQWIVFLSPYQSEYKHEGKMKSGKIITVVTEFAYYEAKQVSEDGYQIFEYPHNIGELPCGIFGGETKTPDIFQPFYESFISPMLPSLDAAARDSSDLQAEKVQHLFSTMWFIQGQSCSACQGTGGVLQQGKQIVCDKCDGRGSLPKSPYRDIEVNLNNLESIGKQVPIPPAGYITKPSEMVALMRNEIAIEIRSALAAVNMEHLDDKPLTQSGDAKAQDSDELNNFVYSIAYHVVEEIIKPIYYFINEIRYGVIVPNKEERLKMLPTISVPEVFDFIKNKNAEANLIAVAGSDVSADIKDMMEMDYINTKFMDNPEVRNRMVVIHDHDPLPGMEYTEYQANLQSGLISKEDVVLHIYIKVFVAQLLCENTDFLDLDFDDQKEILYTMAEIKAKELDAAQSIQGQVPALDENGNPMLDKNGHPIMSGTVEMDATGKMKLDATGMPMLKKLAPNPTAGEKIKTLREVQKQRKKDRDALKNA